MNTARPATSPAQRRIALLVDADNVSQSKIGTILERLSAYGVANIRRAYGDWTSGHLKGWKEAVHAFAIRPVQQFSYSVGKNATDMALVIDAMELLHTQNLDGFCIVSSDADFTPLVMHLRSHDREVYGFGQCKTPEPFANACTSFFYLDAPGEKGTGTKVDAAGAKLAAPLDVLGEAETEVTVRNLAGDTKLVTALRGSVETSAREDGWALLAAAGSNARRQGSIDPRAYGVKGFTALFEKTKLFEIIKSESGQAYVADKRNKQRAPLPADLAIRTA